MQSRCSECCTGNRDKPRNPFGPQRGHDAGSTTTPIIACEYRPPKAEPVHEAEQIVPERSLLPRTRNTRIAESGRPVAAQIWNDDPPPGGGEQGRDAIISVYVIRKSMHQDDRRTIRWTRFLVGDFRCRSQDGLHIAEQGWGQMSFPECLVYLETLRVLSISRYTLNRWIDK
jgi:hypothetical protein